MINLTMLYARLSEINTELELAYECDEYYDIARLEETEEEIKDTIQLLKNHHFEGIDSIIISNIKWDCDDKSIFLPSKLTMEINLNNLYLLQDINGYSENITDCLSDEYGYCVFGYDIKIVTDNKKINLAELEDMELEV